jgi:RNA polymerase sigma factor (sigma-70 family)
MPDANRLALVERTLAGDRAAAETLFTTVLGRTIDVIARRWDYPDLLDELFVHLSENGWRRLSTWKGESSLEGWVRVVANRICYAEVQGRRHLVPLPLGEERDFASEEEQVIETLIREETRVGLLDAIDQLETPRDRLVLRMHYFNGRDLPQIAKEIGVPLSTVYVIKSRAIARLRQRLKGPPTRVDASGR